MSRKMDHTIAFDAPADTLYAVFGDRDYWEQLMEYYRAVATRSEVTEFRCGADGIDVEVYQVLPSGEVPAIVRKVIPLDMAITRRQHFAPYDAERNGAHGTYLASVARTPGRVDGRSELTTTATGSLLQLSFSCQVGVPLIGGKLETMALQSVRAIVTTEEAFTADWIAEHR